MFRRTARVKEIRDAGVNVSIGTDSPASGELNILEEIRFAKKIFKEMYGEELDDKTVVEMVTVNPVKALRLHDTLGSLERDKLGDILVISGNNKKPYSALVQAELKHIALVFMEGKPLYGDETFEPIFEDLCSSAGSDYTRVKIQGKMKIIAGDPTGLVKKMRKVIGFHKELPFLPI
jgi:cytosine/adenosine deaminase-related metal-dependent hydrolase